MTLEDFFTLTEMKSGLTTLARVEELICVMQTHKSCATSNVGDAARQWSTVACTLASTENQDCLSHFVYLNGFCFLNQWLQEAVKYDQDATDAEELINVLLGSLEKLPVDRKKLTASGVLFTVEKLLGHKTADIKVRAQTLFERWNAERINDGCHDLEKGCSNLVESSKPSADATSVEDKHDYDHNFGSPTCQTATEEGGCRIESGRNEKLQAKSPHNLQSNTTDDGLKGSMPHQTMKVDSLIEEKKKSALSPAATLDSSSFEEKLPVGESSISLVGIASSSVPVSPEVQLKDDDDCITSATKNRDDIDAEVNIGLGVSFDSGQRDNFCVPSSTGPAALSPMQKPILVRSTSAILKSINGVNMLESMDTNPGSASVDQVSSKHSRTMAEFKSKEESDKVENLSGTEILQRNEAAEIASEDDLLLNEPILKECKEADDLLFGDPSKISKSKITKELKRKSELDLESGEFDALEVARQVAIEVEREVVDYREQSCSSSTDVSSRDAVSTAILDIAQNKQDHPVSGKPNGNGSASCKDDSDTSSAPINDNCNFSKVTTNLRKVKQSLQSPNQSGDDQKTRNMTQKIKCDFDLNVDVFSENFDCAMNPILSNPVNLSAPVVSFSNGAPVWASTPLHFEDELGWRGSASTSAIGPASLRMAQDSGNTNSVSKPKENLIEIDLNVAESENDVGVDPAVLKDFPVSYCILSNDSSVEVSSGRAARIQFDLNSIGDDEAPSLQSSLLSHHPQKSRRSLSPTSSSSSRKLSMRNVDLNDNLFVLDGRGSQNINLSNSSDFTIMGSKMSLERADDVNQAHLTYMGSRLSWNTFTTGRPLMHMHQVPSPGYDYNGLGIAPAFPFQPALYDNSSIPLMAVARSATVMPQLMGSSGPHGAPLSSHPFLMNITGTPLSSGVESSNPGFDLNSGISQMESGNRVNHFFMPGHSNILEEQMKASSQHSTSGLPLKRKEPDSGWDPYGFGYNQVTPWH